MRIRYKLEPDQSCEVFFGRHGDGQPARFEARPTGIKFEIEHHGFTFVSHHVGINGRPIWPNAEFFVRYSDLTKTQRADIMRFSHGMQEEGTWPFGFVEAVVS